MKIINYFLIFFFLAINLTIKVEANDFKSWIKNFKKRVYRSNLIPSPWEYSSSQKKLMLLKSSMERAI